MKKLLFTSFISLVTGHALGIETITVYGSLVEKDLYNESSSLSLKTADDVDDQEASHFDELLKTIPNLNMSSGTSRGRFFQVRGIGERSSYEGMPNHSVGFVVDDIDYSGISGGVDLTSMSQVEVYKGPQATRLGPSALAGMIHMTSMNPSKKFQAQGSLKVGNYKTWEESIGFAGALNDKITASLSLSKKDSDGYIRNDYLKRDDTNGVDEFSAISKFEGRFSGLKTRLTFHLFDTDNGYDIFNHANSNKTISDKPGRDDQQTLSQALRLEKTFAQSWQTITILTHQYTKQVYSYDEDWGNDSYWNDLPGYNANYNYDIVFPKTREDWSLDQRFVKDQKLIFGGYFKKSKEDFQELGFKNNAQRKNTFGDYDAKTIALYFENESSLSEKTSFGYGLRIERREADYQDSLGNDFSPNETMFGGHFTYNIKPAPLDLYYLKLSKGYKAGGVNTSTDVPQNRKKFKTENLYSFEVGQKKIWNESQLETKLSAFVMYREDIQVKTSFQDDPMDPSSYTFYNDNATNGFNYGVEFEADWKPLPQLDIISSLGLLKTVYGNYSYESTNLKGRQMPHSPEYQFNTFMKYHFSHGFYTSLNYFMSDNYYYSNSHSQKSTPYQLVDLVLGHKFKSLNISVWAKNIFNESYAKRGFYFANMPPNWNDERYTHRGAPRTYGASLKFKF